ncbi:BofC N-terminal domain-containing protein [Jeotgalibacillus proteolyticus]|nr:BofC N-terminal domain-containing protein [Jeotgalibacillus proteolyticus]
MDRTVKALAVLMCLLLSMAISPQAYAGSPQEITVTLEVIYEDGDKSVEEIVEHVEAMEDFWAKYHAWQLVNMSQEEVVFRLRAEEVSPLNVLSGYSKVSP